MSLGEHSEVRDRENTGDGWFALLTVGGFRVKNHASMPWEIDPLLSIGINSLPTDFEDMMDEITKVGGDEETQQKELFVFEPEAGRIELFIRIIYWIVIGIVGGIYGLLAWVCGCIQWFHILFLARRNESLSNFMRGYLEYYVHVSVT